MAHVRAGVDAGCSDHDACGVGFIADRRRRVTRDWLDRGLEALVRLSHRGASGDGPGSADGCGVMTAIPWALFGVPGHTPRPDLRSTRYAAGMCFLPPAAALDARDIINSALLTHGWVHAVWREVPIDRGLLGDAERAACPAIFQIFVRPLARTPRSGRALDASLYRARRAAEAELARVGLDQAAIVSLSRSTIVYKAMVAPENLARFYPDLRAAAYHTPFALFHQRFSTNTFPSWPMAQPFRLLAHNGEINTVLGNRLKALARQRDAASLPELEPNAHPAVSLTGSDSRSLDEAFDLMRQAGFGLAHACARLLPRAFEHDRGLSERERAFEKYQTAVADPWEGPAALAFCDGTSIGMALDRNGFRPARVMTSRDGLVCAGSEAGIFDLPAADVDSVSRLGPGEMLLVDLARGRLLDNRTVRRTLAAAHPYRDRLAAAVWDLPAVTDAGRPSPPDRAALRRLQRIFGYTSEELELIVRPMAVEGRDPVGSMGDDTPLAVLSGRRRVLSDYFRQRFAQVTNPPIDPLREQLVMSLTTAIGRRGRYLAEDAADARLVGLRSPVLSDRQLQLLRRAPERPSAEITLAFRVAGGARGYAAALDAVIATALDAVRAGAVLLVLSDRDVDAASAPLSALLATAAVHQALGRAGLATRAAIVADTAETRDAHQLAALLAFGAAAVCPWLACETARMVSSAKGEPPPGEADACERRYRQSLEHGLLKIMSKMGVCTAAAYTGSQLFEIVGLDPRLVDTHFFGTPHVPGSVTLDSIAQDTCDWHAGVVATASDLLANPGFHGFRRDGDHHTFNPALVRALHNASGHAEHEAYRHFAALVEARPATTVRDLLEFKRATPIPIDQVEPVDAICRRFFASAMSVGALGPEAHRTLAIAMNRLGGRSNSGEGGEEPERRARHTQRDWANSTTKQVASARFGVTPGYLASAQELQIKMAQGSKPGEGGQLPAEKVMPHIAALRYAQPHTALISPPPHHDIYSIEDLAQLVYDLRSFHPTARINVKLVSTSGVGMIAAGVIKAGARAIQISGHAGGTGASPRGSIKHAGLPWEIGLLDAHRVLSARGVRHRVVLQTDGGLATGRDVAMAAALGADEFGFGTAALVALGCVMARQCHLNTCPVGIATQKPELRARFAGSVEQVIGYLRLVAGEVRELLASLGLRSVAGLVGRVDLLCARETPAASRLDIEALLAPVDAAPPREVTDSAFDPGGPLSFNGRILARARPALGRAPIRIAATVRNTDRAVGATLAGALARRFGDAGAPQAPVTLDLTGYAGQSLGAFTLPGLHIHLRGAANDGVGKGMHGGRIVIAPGAVEEAVESPVLIGNAVLYGATGGELFVAGRAGERFAVRNSGAAAVVEGVGHHGCEYMTGGTVIILGEVGANFAAGMTGGVAYVYDPGHRLAGVISRDVPGAALLGVEDEARIKELLQQHVEHTGSIRAERLLARWPRAAKAFRRVSPAHAHEPMARPIEDRTLAARQGSSA